MEISKNHNILDEFTLSVTLDGIPEWTGTTSGLVFDFDDRVIYQTICFRDPQSGSYKTQPVDGTSILITNISDYDAVVTMPLFVTSYVCNNQNTYTLSGVPLCVRTLIAASNPTIVYPCERILDDLDIVDENETYNEIEGEVLSDVIDDLLTGTRWKVKLLTDDIGDFPVVTEMSPVLTLNGTILDQLRSLLDIFTPQNLFGQRLSMFLDVFSQKIIISSPKTFYNPVVLKLDSIHPINFVLQSDELIEKPSSIIMQEFESALYRSENHLEYGRSNIEEYDFKTTSTVDEEDEDSTTITASISGVRTNIGSLTLKDVQKIVIEEETESEISSPKPGFGSSSIFDIVWVENRTTDMEITTEFEYLLGPPYVDSGFKVSDTCFKKSLKGTRQQLARDSAPLKITLEEYPDVLLTTDAIRVTKKSVKTSEKVSSYGESDEDGILYDLGKLDVESSSVSTDIDEVFAYDNDGYLISSRSKKTVTQESGEQKITDTTIVYTPISDDLYAQSTYVMTTEYDKEGNLSDSSFTDMTITTISGDQTGPQSLSSYASSEANDLLEEEIILDSERIVSDDYCAGVLYTGVHNLILEEMRSYIGDSFNTYFNGINTISFESEFINPFSIIIDSFKLVNSDTVNKSDQAGPIKNDLGLGELPEIKQYAVDINGEYKVQGIKIHCEGDSIPIVALALKNYY